MKKKHSKTGKKIQPLGNEKEALLPMGKQRPYLLWYQFLLLAMHTGKVSEGSQHYADWDLKQASRKDWFDNNWRRLFVIENPVSIVQNQLPVPDQNFITVRIALAEPKKKIQENLSEIIDQAVERGGIKLRSGAGAKYQITAGNKPDWEHLAFIRRFYSYYIKDERNLELAVYECVPAIKQSNAIFEMSGYPQKKMEIPSAMLRFYELLMDQKAWEAKGKSASGRNSKAVGGTTGYPRDVVVRYVRTAEKIISNVAQGVFPGDYAS